MNDTFLFVSKWLVAWGLTYGLHSTLFIVGAWLVHRCSKNDALKLAIWQFALVGGVLTTSIALVSGELSEYLPANATFLPSDATVTPDMTAIDAVLAVNEVSVYSTDIIEPDVLTQWVPWVGMGWLLLSAIGAFQLVRGYTRLFGFLREREPIDDTTVLTIADTLGKQAALRRSLVLSVSDAIASPLVLPSGEICLPRRVLSDLTFAQQQSVLAHEVAHIVYKDHVWRVVSQCVCILVPFQILNWYVDRHIRELSEYRADQWAMRKVASPLPLVQSLVQVAEWATERTTTSLVTAMSVHRSSLHERVQRLLEPTPLYTVPRKRVGITILAAITAIVAITPMQTLAATLDLFSSPVSQPQSERIATSQTPPALDAALLTISEDEEYPRNPHATLPPLPTLRATSIVTPTPRPTIRSIVASDPLLLQWPVEGRITVQPGVYHMALDISGEEGTPIRAAAAGTVLQARWDDTGYGYMLLLKHEGKYTTLYAHLQSLTVETGDIVEAGEMIARMGDTGNVTGPALHFEVRESGARVNPYNFLP